jgi:hypothetical protein
MASVRKRTWTSGGKAKTAWIADYFDQSGKRHQHSDQGGRRCLSRAGAR